MSSRFASPYPLHSITLRTLHECYQTFRTIVSKRINNVQWTHLHSGKSRPYALLRILHRLPTLPIALIILWILLLSWGEHRTFTSSVASCDWSAWEQWPVDAKPHRLVLIADPQLVDPHTYPGRPWPLSSVTVAFTDKYLKRSYARLHAILEPDTIFFLGDLFDGGREWRTERRGSWKGEDRWKRYAEGYWLKEYGRFGAIFFDAKRVWPMYQETERRKEKKIITTLPGNHDLGFGTGVQKSVRDRFEIYFGEGNRIDVVGNHTFVSLDTVSMSAFGQAGATKEIWKPTMDFLDEIGRTKARIVKSRVSAMHGLPGRRKFPHTVTHPSDLGRQSTKEELANDLEKQVELPTVLLSHVPLYRPPGAPCGPLRERHPPTAPELDSDEPNAISVSAGYQYQNVLTQDLSKTVTEKVGSISYAFSGDDHDYCEIVHHGYKSAGHGMNEITVKSISAAMGVRKPGFLLVSLWNPVDITGRPVSSEKAPTLQTHLCLLPDTLSILLRYVFLLVSTLVALLVRAVVLALRKPQSGEINNLSSPTSPVIGYSAKAKGWHPRQRAASTSMNSNSSSNNSANLAVRSYNARTRSVSPAPGFLDGYGLPNFHHQARWNAPLVENAGYSGIDNEKDFDVESIDTGPRAVSKPRRKGFARRAASEFVHSVAWVGGPAVLWWAWLLWGD
ncbi:hypothetical protein LTR50_000573 [Elasticomyces elasticus]|nr:hypothetical protein LTR50_000467 [Elasticomyces elasticus]KAK4993348.1 hypothetical protein LTR50_000573 [Elasticomyces elasticus]